MAAKPATTLPLHRLGVDTYNAIVASGALDGQRVELLEGALVEMSPHSPDHAAAIRFLTRHFAGARSQLQVQLPIEVPAGASVPEPDLALLAERPPRGRHPRTALLVIEVAVTSHAIDRGVKAQLYAKAGIPTYWLIDVPGKAVEVRTRPGPDGYADLQIHSRGEPVPCPLEGVAALDLAALLAGIDG